MKKILVADTAKSFRAIVKKELEKGNYEVFEAANSKEVLDNIPTIKPDLVIIEIEMPGTDGFDTSAKFKFEGLEHEGIVSRYNIPIIFVTSNDDTKIREKAKFVGACDCIIKPFMRGELLATVESKLNPINEMSGLKVLAVDDDNLARYFVRNALSECGVDDVVEASSGEEAIKILIADDNKFDLVICDFLMPNMNGDEVCRTIRAELGLKDLPIILLSGAAEKEDIINVYKAGATDYLSKPFIKEEFLTRLKTHLVNKKLNFELQKRVDELKKLNKLKDDFLSVAAHDLRSPLTGIVCSADFLMDKDYLKPEDKKYVAYIKDSAYFLNNMIKDILDLNRIRADRMDLQMTPLKLSSIVKTSLETMKHMAIPKNVEIMEMLGPSDTPILGDYNALMRISNNIISNAIKFTPAGGKVSIRVDHDVSIIIFEVRDTGIGIPEDQRAKLFDKFTMASRTGTSGEKGSGLGLSITKELVEWHDGTLEVDSIVNKGTTVTIKIPVCKECLIE